MRLAMGDKRSEAGIAGVLWTYSDAVRAGSGSFSGSRSSIQARSATIMPMRPTFSMRLRGLFSG